MRRGLVDLPFHHGCDLSKSNFRTVVNESSWVRIIPRFVVLVVSYLSLFGIDHLHHTMVERWFAGHMRGSVRILAHIAQRGRGTGM